MTATTIAMMTLFSGQSLDGWITLAGQWQVRDRAMVCTSAPASIRSGWESDAFELTFRYRRAGNGVNRLAVHSRMTTGGTVLQLTPSGVHQLDSVARPTPAPDPDTWIDVHIIAGNGELRARSEWSTGSREATCPLAPGQRGFLRFQTTEPGLEIRDVRVAEPGFVMMLGDSLDGWEPVRPRDPDDPGWVVEDGVVRCLGHRSSWLRTLRTYDDFVLRLEYKLPPKGNSGIFLRAPLEGRVSRIGLEIQLLDDVPDRGRIKPAQHTGSIYDGIGPETHVPAPVNQWNAIEIRLDGRQIRTTLNGIELYDARLDDAARDTNSHRRPLTTRRTVGFIGLQDHSTPVRFRNIRIRELD